MSEPDQRPLRPSRALRLALAVLKPKPRVRVRRIHRLGAAFALLTPTLWILLVDLARRSPLILRLPRTQKWFYRGSLAMSLLFWSVLLLAASRRRGGARHVIAGVFVLLFTVSLGVQGGFFGIFRTYDSVEGEIYSKSFFWPWLGSLPLGQPIVWFYFGLSFAAAIVMVRNARRFVRPRRARSIVASMFAPVLVFSLPFVGSSYHTWQAATPDVLYFHAVSASYREQLGITKSTLVVRPQKRRAKGVPPLIATPAKKRNVLFILQESQRFDVTCTEFDPECPRATVTSNLAVPRRLPLLEWRSLDSSTNLSCATLWTGLLPSDPKEDLETAPTLFRFAKSAGYTTGYFTSQHLVYENMRMQMQDEPIDRFQCATTLDFKANWDTGARDALLSEYVIAHWDELPEPFFIVVHYSNQHYPYVLDPHFALFASDPTQSAGAYVNLMAQNKNAVYLSDVGVGRMLDHIKHTEKAERTVILYTSDHGEALGDNRVRGHTFSLYDSEIHVPTWVDAPPGALTTDEERNIRERKKERLTHADMAPTLLDLLGVWDAAEVRPFRAKMMGHPITRDERTKGPLPLTNCSWIWECMGRNWGYMDGPRKFFGVGNHAHFHCYNLDEDPAEQKDLGADACPDLLARTKALFPPFDEDSRPYRPLR